MKRGLSLMLAIVMLLAIGSVAVAAPLAKEQVMRYNDGTEPETIDPAKSTGIPESNVEINLFEGLTRLGLDNQPVPGVAEKWTVSADGLVYTFKLRKSTWSNGEPVTAHDFVYSWHRALAPETASEYAYQLYYIKNGEEYNSGKIKDANQLGVKAIDDYTLQVTLAAPTAYFLSLTSFPTLFPVNKKAVAANPTGWSNKAETFVGNGPFKLEKWEHQSKITLVKNPKYWDAKHVKLQKVVMTLIPEASTELTMYESGELDIADNLPTPDIPRLKKSSEWKLDPMLGTYYYIINCKKFPDKRVRKALAMAIDRQGITDDILKAGQIPAYAMTPPGFPDAKKGTDYRKVGGAYFKEDIAAAKKLLAEAGYPNGKGLTVEILYNTSEAHKKIAEAIQQMWKKNLGIDTKIVNQEWKVYLDTRDSDNFDVARAGWIGDYVDAMTFMDLQVTGGGNNDSKWGNKEYDRLIDIAKTTKDTAKRIQAMHDAEKILMDEMPVIPIYFYTNPNLYKPYVKSVHYTPFGHVDFKLAYIQKH